MEVDDLVPACQLDQLSWPAARPVSAESRLRERNLFSWAMREFAHSLAWEAFIFAALLASGLAGILLAFIGN